MKQTNKRRFFQHSPAGETCLGHLFNLRSREKPRSASPIERLSKEAKRRADVVGIFPNGASVTRLIGAVLFERNDEGRTASRYTQVEAFARIDRGETDPVPSIATQAA